MPSEPDKAKRWQFSLTAIQSERDKARRWQFGLRSVFSFVTVSCAVLAVATLAGLPADITVGWLVVVGCAWFGFCKSRSIQGAMIGSGIGVFLAVAINFVIWFCAVAPQQL